MLLCTAFVYLCQVGGEVRVSLSLDDENCNVNSAGFSEADAEFRDNCSTSNTADDVAASTPRKRRTNGSTSPVHITIDVSPNSDGENPENTETPTSPKDVSHFSKRAGMTPSTPPIREPRSKVSSSSSEERPKRKGCCVIV